MITELQHTIDRADSVSIILAKSGDQYIATLVVKTPEGQDPLPPVQVTASIEEIDDEVSKAFNEVSEVFTSTADSIAEFKKAAAASAEAAKPKPAATPAKKTATKKAAKKVAKPAPAKPAKPAPAKPEVKVIPAKVDAETQQALEALGL